MFENRIMTKSDDTRRTITEIALRSFQDRGYEQTTIRLIADEAGISTGNAYYHFPSKVHLVQALYERVQSEHRRLAADGLAAHRDLGGRLEAAILAGLEAIGPYHDSAPGFLAAAISPTSPINPLSADSAAARDIAVSVFEDVVAGATGVPEQLRRRLPLMLFLGYLAVALYWVYDRSPRQRSTRRLVAIGTRLFVQALPLLRLPPLRNRLDELLDLVGEVLP